MENTPTLLPAGPMARRLRVPVAWLKAQALAGHIPHLNADGRLLFRPDVVEQVLADRAAGQRGGKGCGHVN